MHLAFSLNWLLVGAATVWLCAVVGGLSAARKGQSRGEWFLFGYLFGPVGLLVLACLRGKEKRRGPAADQAAVGDIVGPGPSAHNPATQPMQLSAHGPLRPGAAVPPG
jgi:hypothetical protein